MCSHFTDIITYLITHDDDEIRVMQILEALECLLLEMLNCADRPTEEQVDRFDRLYTAALVHQYADTSSH